MTDFLYMIALLPVIGILYYIYSLDKNPEPRKLVLRLFFTGAFGSVFLTLLLITKITNESFLSIFLLILISLLPNLFTKMIVIKDPKTTTTKSQAPNLMINSFKSKSSNLFPLSFVLFVFSFLEIIF